MKKPLPPPTEKVYDLARRLIGTPAMGEIQDEISELNLTEAKQLDLIALMCEGCDWWFPRIDIVDTGTKYLCHECLAEHKGD